MNENDQDREMRLANFEKQMRLCSKISSFLIDEIRMTDRETVELAAKAAKIKIAEWNEIEEGYRREDGGYFRPLDDSSDAFRLAITLRLCVDCNQGDSVKVFRSDKNVMASARLGLGIDEFYVVRHTIVRAAAQIGRLIK